MSSMHEFSNSLSYVPNTQTPIAFQRNCSIIINIFFVAIRHSVERHENLSHERFLLFIIS